MLATRTRSGKPHRELGGHQTLATWQYSSAIYMLGRPVPPLRKATLSPSTTRIINENDQTANTRIPACLHRKGRASDRLIYKKGSTKQFNRISTTQGRGRRQRTRMQQLTCRSMKNGARNMKWVIDYTNASVHSGGQEYVHMEQRHYGSSRSLDM